MFYPKWRFENGGIVIDPEHYPNAEKIVRIDGGIAREIKVISSHFSEMKKCEYLLSKIESEEFSGIDNFVSNYLFEYCVVKFYLCFSNKGARKGLSYKKVYKGEKGAYEVFEYFKNLRNKCIVHDEGQYNEVLCGLVLNNDQSEEIVEDFICVNINAGFTDKYHMEQMGNLVRHARDYLLSEFEEKKNFLLKEYREKDASWLRSLELVNFVVPKAERLVEPKKW